MHIDIYHLPEIETHYHHTLDLPDFETLEFTADEDTKLTRAAQRGPTAIKMALAGDEEALREMRRLKIVKWETRRP